jgi:hypothetical protein
MTLLAPAALAFAALLSVPVVIHLFRPRRVRQTPFSSLRWLEHSPQKLSRRIRPHQLLLFAMRAGFILLLVFALAQPLFSSPDAVLGERVIVVDVSRSMALRLPGKPTPLERAREIAAQLVESAPPGTRTTVLLTANTTRRLGPADRDATVLLPELRQVEASASDTNLASALPMARPLLARSGRPAELVFITDNQQGAWDAAAIAAFAVEAPTGLQLRVIDVSGGAAVNGWIASARLVEVGESPSRILLRIELAASGEQQDRTLRVTGVPGEPEAVRNVTLIPGQPTILHLEVPSDADLRGKDARISLDPPDALPDDDEFFVCLDARAALRVLVIEADSTGPEAMRPGFPLRKAMKALADTGTRAVRITRRGPTTVSAADLSANDVVVLADVPELPESVTTALVERVRQGAGVAVFLGPRVKADWYNANLTRPLQPEEGLLPVTIGERVNAPERLAWVLPTRPHALLAGLGDPLVGDLAEVSSERYHRLDGTLPGSVVIAKMPDQTPVLVEHHLGAGTVLLVNASPDTSFSDLPRRRSFIPFTDRMLAGLGKGRGRELTAGEPTAVPLEGVRPGETVTLVEPGGLRRTLKARGEGNRGVLELAALDRPGVYRAEYQDGSFAFAVNAGRGDSLLSPTDPASLKAWWHPLDCVIEPATEAQAQKPARGPFALWPWLLAAAALLLATETIVAAMHCPRLAPPATTSLIQKQRLEAGTVRDS